MVFWSEVDKNSIESIPTGKDVGKMKYKICGEPLRFQVPRGLCTWGVSAYKSMQVDLSNPDFIEWWKDLETQLCPLTPFNSNLKGSSLRIKVDDATYIFDENSKQVVPEVREGLFRGQELSCLIDVESNYFFNGNWGLTVRAAQIKTYGEPEPEPEPESEPETLLVAGRCAFIKQDS
jgi:hypothetical protein